MPPWLFVQQVVPDANVTKRWEAQGQVGPFVAIGIPGRMLETWDEEVREVGRQNFSITDRLNTLLLSWEIPFRLSPDDDGLEKDLFVLCTRASLSIYQVWNFSIFADDIKFFFFFLRHAHRGASCKCGLTTIIM